MEANDIYKLLDITPKPTSELEPYKPIKDDERPIIRSQQAIANLDEWDIARGEALRMESSKVKRCSPATLADFHAAYYHKAPELQECADGARKQFLQDVMETAAYRATKVNTTHNLYTTLLAVEALAKEWAEAQSENEEDLEGDAAPASDDGDSLASFLQGAKAAGAVQDQIREAQEVQGALAGVGGNGAGVGSGTETTMSQTEVLEQFRKIQDNPHLRRIFELAGAYRRIAQSQQQKKTKHGCEEFVGVTFDNDPGKLLPAELARLNDPDLELDMLRRLAERQTMAREYASNEHLGKGPVVICVDESGSMTGERIAQAKAFCLAMVWIARHQKRDCLLVAFAGSSYSRNLLVNGRTPQVQIVEWLFQFMGGGTVFTVPLSKVPNKLWKQYKLKDGETDMFLLTDGAIPLAPALRDSFNAWKKQMGCRLTSIGIGIGQSDNARKRLEPVSDVVYTTQQLTAQTEGVRDCFSF